MLNVQTEHLDDHTARLTVEVEPERIERGMQQAAKRIARKANVRGFRPGKAPYNVIVNFYGREYVLGEALDELGDEIYREALEASGIEPYAPGSLENVEAEGQKLVFVVPKEPTAELGDYRALRVEAETPEVTDEMVNDAMENVRESQAVVEPVERAAQMGDQITFEHVLVLDLTQEEEPTPEEQRDAAILEAAAELPELDDEGNPIAEPDEEDDDLADYEPDEDEEDHETEQRVVFHQDEWEDVLRDDKHDLFPGFSAQWVGVSAGEEREFVLDLPADFDDEELAGHQVRVEGRVSQVASRAVPDWSDGLAQRTSDNQFQTILELRMDVRKQLQTRMEQATKQRIADEALEKLVEGATLHYPPALVDDYVKGLLDEMDRDMRQQGLTLQDFKRILGKTDEELAEMYRPRGEQRARRAIALGEFIRREELAATPEDLEAQIDFLSQRMGGEQAPQFRRMLDTDASRANLLNALTTDRAVDRLVAIARGEEPAVGVDRAAEAAERAVQLATQAPSEAPSEPESAPANPLSAGVGESSQTE